MRLGGDGMVWEGITQGDGTEAAATPAETSGLAREIFEDAVSRGASDVHLHCLADAIILRYRIHGTLRDVRTLSLDRGRRLIHHLKAIAGMNILERRRPQDGRVILDLAGGTVDLRLATIDTFRGENLAVRIFDKRGPGRRLRDLGLARSDYSALRDLCLSPRGLLLVTGPTGAGKTTTLYAMINEISRPEINIITVEDPVEYEIPRVNQIGVQNEIGVGFLECLRSAFRHDPDVLMVGEVRDPETARIAIRAALSGHLVFTTLHTGLAAEGITSLINLGIEPFLVASSLIGVVAQQLVRTICPECRVEVPLEMPPEHFDAVFREELARWGALGRPVSFSFGQGCERCFASGHGPRTGLFEILRISTAVRRAIVELAPAGEIDRIARAEGMVGLRAHGIRLVLEGRSTIEEILRVAPVPELALMETPPLRASAAPAR